MSTNINPQEIEHFSKDSAHWWDMNGPFKPLHKLNPVRLSYLRTQILAHFQVPEMTGINILDVGCGGGLVCEPLARQGAHVTGIDADDNAIEVARAHALSQGLDVIYEATTLEEVNDTYDVVLALEIIEHVPDRDAFIESCFQVCKPGGLVIFSTLNRTAKSYALGIIGAEYILGWVPKGTHSWKKFVKPSEIARTVRDLNAQVKDISGLRYHPLSDRFSIDPQDVDVNYFLVAGKDTSAPRK